MDDEEKAKRSRNYLKRVEAIMLEAAKDLVTDENKDLTIKKITKELKSNGIPITRAYLKSFHEGFKMAMAMDHLDDPQAIFTVLMCIQMMVEEKKNPDMDKIIEESMKNIGKK